MLNLFADFSTQDPSDALAEAADGCPYQWEPETQAVYAFRADDVRKILTSKDFWNERAEDCRITSLAEEERERRARLKGFLACWPVFSDGEYHSRIRHVSIRLLRDVVTPELRGSWERLVTRRLGEVGNRRFDWMEQVARPLAREAVVPLTGDADADRLIELGSVVINELATPRIDMERVDAALEAVDALRDWLRDALADPPSAFVAGLAEVADDEELGLDHATALLTQVVTGAYEPTVAALGVAGERVTGEVLTGLPLRTVRDEVFRLATPFRFASRYARRPITVGPHHLETGDRIVLCLGTANLDPGRYPEPQEFRQRKRHPRSFSFGLGRHHCPGAPIAQAIMEVLLTCFAKLDVHFLADQVELEPDISIMHYRRLDGRMVRSGMVPVSDERRSRGRSWTGGHALCPREPRPVPDGG